MSASIILASILLLFLAASLVYSLLSVIAAVRYLVDCRRTENLDGSATLSECEPISVLKPLSGLDEGMEENLRAFFEQNYPNYELLFAVRTEADPCVPLVRRLCAEHPAVPSQLIFTGEPPYPHAKAYSLSRMLAEARYQIVVMSDSDIRVTRDFLKHIAAEFRSETGADLATCPYRAIAGRSFWSRLEADGMNTTFWQGALTARLLEGMKFAVGPTIVARKKVIEAAGGMDELSDYVAEDFELGVRAAKAGFRVILSSYVVEHRIGSETASQNFRHRIRWGRTSRRSRPLGYIGQLFTYPLPLALLVLVTTPQWWPAVVLAIAIRFASAWVTSAMVLQARLNWVLLPVEDIFGFIFWFAAFFGDSVTWRGRTYRINSQGKVVARS